MLTQRIEDIITPALTDWGYAVVRVSIHGEKRKTVQIMIDHIDHSSITVDDCERVSRHVAAVFDVEDLIPFAYVLEVSSPGIDRPLVKKQDFFRFVGYDVFVETHKLMDQRKRFQGQLESATETDITVTIPPSRGGEAARVRIPYDDIRCARLSPKFGF